MAIDQSADMRLNQYSYLYQLLAGSLFLLLLLMEQQPNLQNFVFYLLPVVVFLVLFTLYQLIRDGKKVMQFFVTFRGAVALVYLLLLGFLCFTPINEFTSYLSKETHPFNFYHWLIVSLIGFLFAFSLLLYLLSCNNGIWMFIVKACRSVWSLPAPYFIAGVSLWVFLASNIISYSVFEHIPHVQDSIAQLFQAKIFAQGWLTAPVPSIPEFFQYYYDNIIITDRWYSQYPLGHPFFLMLGVLCGMPWIINPLFAAGSVIVLYHCATRYYGEKEGRLSVILFCISPFVLFMSSSFMNHVSTLFFLLLFLYSIQRAWEEQSSLYSCMAGCAIGVMFNIRPGEAFVIGAVFAGWFFIVSVREKVWRPFLYFASMLCIFIGILLLYNYATNGDPLLFGYQVRWGKHHSLGFNNIKVMDYPVFTPLRAIIHTLSNLIALNQNLFEWPFPSLLPVMIFWMPFLFKKNGYDYLLLCGFLSVPGFYFFYFFQDLCLGPRFYYSCLPFVVMLTARALFQIAQGIASLRRCSELYVRQVFMVLLVLSVLFCGCFRIPRLYQFYSDSFWEVDDKLMKKVKTLGIKNALIFQKSYGQKLKDSDLGSGFLHNTPGLNGPIVFARDLGERNAELVPFFPGRNYYLASRDGRGEVIIEPLNVADKKRK